MANIKISELSPLVTVQDADVLPIVDNAITKKVTAAILRSYTEGNSVLLTGAQTIAGIKTFTSQLASSVATGTAPFSVASTTKVTNLNADLLDGLSSADFQATLSGTGIVKSTAGTISYLTDNSSNWNTAFNDKINSAAVTGSGTNTLTLTQQDAGTITATWVNGTLIREIRNNTGATLTKGTIVYISGATGNKPTVSKAIATGDSTSAQTFGFIQEDIANNANGYVVVVGDLTGVDTSAFNEGDQLYLSSTTAGAFTSTKQYAPNHLVYVGIVTRSHPTLGQIEVNIQNGYEMDELHNVAAQNPSNGDILQFVTSTGLWTKVAGSTSNISEGTNLYYTDARSRSAFSESVTGLDYNSTTGVLSTTSGYGIPTTASQATWDTAYNDSIVSAAVTGTTTKTLTLNQQDGGTVTASWTDINTDAVSSVFGRTGAVVATSGDYTTTQVTEGTNLYFTDARSRNAISLTTTGTSGAATYNSTTGVLNVPNYADTDTGITSLNGLTALTQTFAVGTSGTDFGISSATSTHTFNLPTASATNRGALSSADWTTFNSKQNALTNPITGTGTTNYLPKFTGATALGNSLVYDDGTNVGIGTTTPDRALTVNGQISLNGDLISTKGGTTFRIGYESYTATGGVNMFTEGAVPLVLGTTSTERMRITSAGNVGIGNTNPTNALDVYNTTTNARINIQGTTNPVLSQYTNSSGPLYIGIDDSAGANYTGTPYARFIYSAFNYPLAIFTDGTERMRITGTGNVGIGTSSPSEELEVYKSQNGITRLLVSNPDTTNTNSRAAINVSSGSVVGEMVAITGLGLYFGTASNNFISFITNGSSRMDLSQAGNLLLNTTTDGGFKLDVNGTARLSGELLISTPDDSGMRIKAGATRLSYIDFADANTGTPSGSISYNHTSDYFVISVGGSNAEKMRVKSNTINFSSLPTSSAGLSAGDIWNNLGILSIV
jgi:hypothetical protein